MLPFKYLDIEIVLTIPLLAMLQDWCLSYELPLRLLAMGVPTTCNRWDLSFLLSMNVKVMMYGIP